MKTKEEKHPTKISPLKQNLHGQNEPDQKKLDDLLHPPPTTAPCSSFSTEMGVMGGNVFDFSVLSATLPTLIWRSRWDKIAEQVGLPYRRSYMQNLSSEGTGPVEYVLNKRIYYKSQDVIRWLNQRQSNHSES